MTALVLAAFSVLVDPAIAQEETVSEGDGESRHRIELVAASTYVDHSHNATAGVVYLYTLTDLVQIGGVVEYVGDGARELIVAFEAVFRPHAGWAFITGIGLDRSRAEGTLLLRAGVGYEFEITEKWSVAPEFIWDSVNGDPVQVMGIAFGYQF